MNQQARQNDAGSTNHSVRKITLIVIGAVAIALWIGVMWGERLGGGEQRAVPTATGDSADDQTKVTYYTCGMHPWVILPKPGDCPICHMKLTPLDPKKFTGEVTIDPVVVQNIGVRVGPVVSGPLVRSIRTVGSVDYDETRVRDVNIKVAGWIEKLHIDYLGAAVRRGDTLFDIYSPDLYAAQEEYLLALRGRGKIGADFVPEAAQGAQDLLEAARTKLLYFDITPQQIAALEAQGKPAKTMAILSPHDGVVIEKHANEGMGVDPGMRVYRIADLAKVWVMVTLYEQELPYVQLGQRAIMSLPYIPGQDFEGKVIYVYPYLDTKTRQVNVRLEFDNPAGVLKPGMFANVNLQSTLAEQRTLAPREAIIDTGQRQVAFVSLGEGKFEPRDVTMGIETGDGMVEIRDGLKPGEMVVTSGQFLIDSEAKIREALAKMIRGDMAADQHAVAVVAGQSELTALPQEAAAALGEILDGYFGIADQLASDSTDNITADARKIATGVDALLAVQLPETPHFWHQHDEIATVRAKALELIDLEPLDQVRLKFADLSVALAKLAKATGIPPSYGRQVQQLHCPMYREGQGGSVWLQVSGAVRNPFFGETMLGCFDQRTVLPVTGESSAETAPLTAPSADETRNVEEN